MHTHSKYTHIQTHTHTHTCYFRLKNMSKSGHNCKWFSRSSYLFYFILFADDTNSSRELYTQMIYILKHRVCIDEWLAANKIQI